MTGHSHPSEVPDGPTGYELRLAGRLDARWSGWLEARELVADDDGCTTLSVVVADQAQLYDVLTRVRDLGRSSATTTLRLPEPRWEVLPVPGLVRQTAGLLSTGTG